jgi:hypothetical protein
MRCFCKVHEVNAQWGGYFSLTAGLMSQTEWPILIMLEISISRPRTFSNFGPDIGFVIKSFVVFPFLPDKYRDGAGSGAHPSSYPVDTRVSFPVV